MNSTTTPAFTRPLTHMKRIAPLRLTAEIRFRPNRPSVVFTTGVCPFLAQAVPWWKSDRTPASSPNQISPFAFFAWR